MIMSTQSFSVIGGTSDATPKQSSTPKQECSAHVTTTPESVAAVFPAQPVQDGGVTNPLGLVNSAKKLNKTHEVVQGSFGIKIVLDTPTQEPIGSSKATRYVKGITVPTLFKTDRFRLTKIVFDAHASIGSFLKHDVLGYQRVVGEGDFKMGDALKMSRIDVKFTHIKDMDEDDRPGDFRLVDAQNEAHLYRVQAVRHDYLVICRDDEFYSLEMGNDVVLDSVTNMAVVRNALGRKVKYSLAVCDQILRAVQNDKATLYGDNVLCSTATVDYQIAVWKLMQQQNDLPGNFMPTTVSTIFGWWVLKLVSLMLIALILCLSYM